MLDNVFHFHKFQKLEVEFISTALEVSENVHVFTRVKSAPAIELSNVN